MNITYPLLRHLNKFEGNVNEGNIQIFLNIRKNALTGRKKNKKKISATTSKLTNSLMEKKKQVIKRTPRS